ncbi:Sin3b [Mycena kentingensis (nom. inval.)]|nr:Sin3b [Mycena kentingensis (nom. inval.)]
MSTARINIPYSETDVITALTYLNIIKLRFAAEPAKYNNFIEIMKNYKNETIDAATGIERVVQLFHGYPSLIGGFKTFLPPEYSIDCVRDGADYTVTINTPTGTVTSTGTVSEFDSGTTVPLAGASARIEPDRRPFEEDPICAYLDRVRSRCSAETYEMFLGEVGRVHSLGADPVQSRQELLNAVQALFPNDPELVAECVVLLQVG